MKVVLVVVVVVLLLFVAALGVGAGQDRGDGDLGREGIGAWLADKFLRPVPPVSADELSAGCRQGAVLFVEPGGTCTVTVAESSRFSRTLKLVATAGVARVALDRDKALDVAIDVAPGEDAEAEIDLGRDEAELVVTCSGIERCALEVAS